MPIMVRNVAKSVTVKLVRQPRVRLYRSLAGVRLDWRRKGR